MLLDHIASEVTFCVEPSEKVPVAVNDVLDPIDCVADEGVTLTLVSVGAGDWQVMVVCPCIAPLVA